jgi:hypothetical protein
MDFDEVIMPHCSFAREWIGMEGAILKFLDVDYFQKASTGSLCTRISKLLCRVILIEEERQVNR